MNWLIATLLSLCAFGLWGFFSKLSVFHIDPKSALIYQTIGVALIGLLTLYFVNFKPAVDAKDISFGVLTGIAYGIGCLFYFMAASKGKIITVVAVTGLYPAVTAILAFLLLKEAISIKQFFGIGLAFISILLIST